MTRIGQRLTKSPYLRLFFLSCLVGLGVSVLNKLLVPFGTIHLWLALDLVLESVFALALYSFCRSLATVISVQFLFGALFRGANAIKIHYLDTPILPSDFFLLDDLYLISPAVKVAFVGGAFVAVLALCGFLIWRRFKWPKGLEWFAAAPAALVLSWIFLFPDHYSESFNALLRNQTFSVPFLLKERGQTIGVPLSFTLDLARFLKLRKQDPSEKDIQNVFAKWDLQDVGARSPDSAAEKPRRNVYIILVESFWDPSNLLQKVNGQNYLSTEFDQAWQANGRHYMLSPMFGGGTANVEFEILCGIPSRLVTRGIVFQVALANHLPCLPKILSDAGYKTFAFHPFAPGYYNRKTAFPLLGFDHFFAMDELSPGSDAESFLPDQEFIEKSIQIARQSSQGHPYLAYMMTIAGHWPYNWKPAADDEPVLIPGKDKKPDLAIVERHFNLNRSSSKVLAKALAALQLEDPTAIVVMAGDHLPELADDLVLNANSEDITDRRFYMTPLIFKDGQEESVAHIEESEPLVSAYKVGGEILSHLRVPASAQAHFPWFRIQRSLDVRPLQNGAFLLTPEKASPDQQYAICKPESSMLACQQVHDWLQDFHLLAADLVHGSQHALKSHE